MAEPPPARASHQCCCVLVVPAGPGLSREMEVPCDAELDPDSPFCEGCEVNHQAKKIAHGYPPGTRVTRRMVTQVTRKETP